MNPSIISSMSNFYPDKLPPNLSTPASKEILCTFELYNFGK